MAVYRLDVAYDGSGFRGYAKQKTQRTVQGAVDSALETLLGSPIATSVAGRTDAGVHARGQVISFPFDGEDLVTGHFSPALNGILAPEITVISVAEVDEGFNARFSAIWRRYRYLIDTRHASDPLTRHFTWHVGRSLHLDSMQDVASQIVGEHDFTSFCRSVEGKSNVRLVNEAYWADAEGRYEFWIRANAFCHQMVRSLVGYMYDVGRGFSPVDEVDAVVGARDRTAVVTVAPPHGLTLWEVGYP